MIAGDMELSLEWNFVLSGYSPCPISFMAPQFKKNLRPYLVKYKINQDEIKKLLDLYIKRCFPVDNINRKDVVKFTWNVKNKALSCSYNNNENYKSISETTKGVNLLAKAIFEFTLDYNEQYVVDLLPHLWLWQ